MIGLIIECSDTNGGLCIGEYHKLPWESPKFFKSLTQGKKTILGNNAWRMLKPDLTDSINIVLTKYPNQDDDCIKVPSLIEALTLVDQDEEVFILGGESVFNQAFTMNIVDKIYLCKIDGRYSGSRILDFGKLGTNYGVTKTYQHIGSNIIELTNNMYYDFSKDYGAKYGN